MALVLDTSALISLEKEEIGIIKKIKELSKEYEPPVFVTFISVFEFLIGLKLSLLTRKTAARNFLNQFSILNTTNETAELMESLKSEYDKKGHVMSLADLIIASLVIENKMVFKELAKTDSSLRMATTRSEPLLGFRSLKFG